MLRFAITNENNINELKERNDTNENKRKKNLSKYGSESSSDDDNDDDKNLNNKNSISEKNIDEEDVKIKNNAEYFNRQQIDQEEEEKNLESLVFGSSANILNNINKLNKKKARKSGGDIVPNEEDENKKDKKIQIADTLKERKPAWQDTDDLELVNLNKFSQFSSLMNTNSNQVTSSQIEESLKARFTKFYGTPMWADLEFKKKNKNKRKKKSELTKDDIFSSDDSDDDNEEQDGKDQESDQDNLEESLFRQTGNYLASSNSKNTLPKTKSSLPKSIIDMKVCTDANKEEPHQARLKSVEFHPSARVILTAGLNQKLTLFQIDGKKNPKIQTIFIEKFPILSAHFTKQSGDEIIIGSRHKNFYYYDMNAGKIVTVVPPVKALDEYHRPSISNNFEISPDNKLIAFIGSQGQIHLFTVKSKEWIDTLKINDSCNAIAFSSDSRYLFAFGDDKVVNVFDMNERGHRCLHKFTDYGCLSGTSIAVSNNSQFIATGCKSGVVNIYNLNNALLTSNRSPKPIKSFMNLTTPCTSLKFNSTNEILAACSSFDENACKLIHVASLSVFSNFPLKTDKTLMTASLTSQMRIPQCIDFSLNSGYFAIGNHKGNALLYRLKHYGSF